MYKRRMKEYDDRERGIVLYALLTQSKFCRTVSNYRESRVLSLSKTSLNV